MKLADIMVDVRQGSLAPHIAAHKVKELVGALVEEAAIGISNVDATDMYGEICSQLEEL